MLNYSKINKIIKNLNIVKIINNYVKLEKEGTYYKGYSPFNKETNPSFIVSYKKNIWKDFSSGKGGTLISFIMQYFNWNYNKSIIYLLKKFCNIKYKNFININKNNYNFNTLLNKNIKIFKKKQKIIEIIKKVNFYYKKLLKQNPLVIDLLKRKGLNKKIIKKFELGYAPNNFQFDFLNKKKKKKLISTGLFKYKNNIRYNFFFNRIIFPIKNINGEIIAFGGRNIYNNNKSSKYINTPNNYLYNKSKILYGLYNSKKYIYLNKLCFIVEGYMDLLSLYQNNIKNVVATLGTNITQYQINLIKKITNNVILLYDGDKAGLLSANKNINFFLKNSINIKFFIFPKSEDPNSFLKKNKKKIKNLKKYFIKKSLNFLDFKKFIFKKYLKDPYKKYILIKTIINNIENIPQNLIKDFYLKKLEKKFNINLNSLYKDFYLNNYDYYLLLNKKPKYIIKNNINYKIKINLTIKKKKKK
ncbi:MAG: DNA primase, partial [Candidatus Shikimatogenerans sp. JK-2022]|nr:DNA primase [Candidatus Shikimatogenerans bostrichidophilus]